MHGMDGGDRDQVDEFSHSSECARFARCYCKSYSRGVVGESSVSGSRLFLSTESKLCFAPSRISAFSVSAFHSHTCHTIGTVFQSFLAVQDLSCNTTLVLKFFALHHGFPPDRWAIRPDDHERE